MLIIFGKLSLGASKSNESAESFKPHNSFTYIAENTTKYYLELKNRYSNHFINELQIISTAGILVAKSYEGIGGEIIIDEIKRLINEIENNDKNALFKFIIGLEVLLLIYKSSQSSLQTIENTVEQEKNNIHETINNVLSGYRSDSEIILQVKSFMIHEKYKSVRDKIGLKWKSIFNRNKMPNVATQQNKKIDFWSQSKISNYIKNKKSNTSSLNHEVLSDIGTPIEERIKDESTKQQNKAIQDLLISANNKTPEVDFKGTGILWIKGRSIPEDASSFYYEIERWIDKYCLNPATETTINIMLEYFNDGGYKYVLRILRKLEEIGNSLIINWYYDEIDKDMKDLIEMFSESIRSTIKIIPIKEGNDFIQKRFNK